MKQQHQHLTNCEKVKVTENCTRFCPYLLLPKSKNIYPTKIQAPATTQAPTPHVLSTAVVTCFHDDDDDDDYNDDNGDDDDDDDSDDDDDDDDAITWALQCGHCSVVGLVPK